MTPSIAIVGRGFGLYGYAVAASSMGYRVRTLSDYIPTIEARGDLRCLDGVTEFFSSPEELLEDRLDAFVIAVAPSQQVEYLRRLRFDDPLHLFLEKPLAPSLGERESILRTLKDSGLSFSIAYLFPLAPWYTAVVRAAIASRTSLSTRISWRLPQIRRNRDSGNWKDQPRLGGGVLSFYAIHFAPLAMELSLDTFELDRSTPDRVVFLARSEKTHSMLSVDCGAGNPEFEVSTQSAGKHEEILYRDKTPFSFTKRTSEIDERVPLLRSYLKASLSDRGRVTSKSLDLESYVGRMLEQLSPAEP